MSELEEKLGAVLNNPQMMGQIMALAQSMGQGSQDSPPAPEAAPAIDPGILRAVSSLAGQNRVDDHQQALLGALEPYLSQGRVEKLERAMRAARMTRTVSALLRSGALNGLAGG